MKSTWQSYEQVAAYLLNKFAVDFDLINVEGKQSIPGIKTGTQWEIDAKGIRQGNSGFVIVECRHYTKAKQNQGKLGQLAYSIIDTGAEGGIIVSPLGIQSGAQLVADAENIITVTLHPKSTPTEFFMQFLNKLFIGIHEQAHAIDSCDFTLIRICEMCNKSFTVQSNEQVCPSCLINI